MKQVYRSWAGGLQLGGLSNRIDFPDDRGEGRLHCRRCSIFYADNATEVVVLRYENKDCRLGRVISHNLGQANDMGDVRCSDVRVQPPSAKCINISGAQLPEGLYEVFFEHYWKHKVFPLKLFGTIWVAGR
jgi:hypothetical protein